MALDYNTALDEYGAVATFAQNNPEVNGILQQAIAGEWDAARFERALWGTNWYKSLTDQQRQLQVQQATDPATYNIAVAHKTDQVDAYASAAGLSVNTRDLAQQALWWGWDDNTLQRKVADAGAVQHGYSGAAYGQVGDYVNNIRATYESYGLDMGQAFYENQARMIAAGRQTTGGAANEAIAQASKMFPQYTQDFMEGRTLSQIAQPFIQQMGTTLEIDPSSINLNDPKIQQALQGDGKTPMTMYQFQQQLKSDPRWAKTDNAKNAGYDLLAQISSDWGFGK